MAPIGLAHRPAQEFVADWTDADSRPGGDEELHDAVERRLDQVAPAAEPAPLEAPVEDRDGTPGGDVWLAGEPMS